jgi:hypothetical protein
MDLWRRTTLSSYVRKAKIGVEGGELYLFQYLAGAQRALKSLPVVGGFSAWRQKPNEIPNKWVTL